MMTASPISSRPRKSGKSNQPKVCRIFRIIYLLETDKNVVKATIDVNAHVVNFHWLQNSVLNPVSGKPHREDEYGFEELKQAKTKAKEKRKKKERQAIGKAGRYSMAVTCHALTSAKPRTSWMEKRPLGTTYTRVRLPAPQPPTATSPFPDSSACSPGSCGRTKPSPPRISPPH